MYLPPESRAFALRLPVDVAPDVWRFQELIPLPQGTMIEQAL
jgi:hypothetical protein